MAERSDPGDFVCIEDCDGKDLRESTCASRGYRNGSLSCTRACNFDESKCEGCAPLDAHLLACGTNERPGGQVALAATDTAIALAFVEDGGLWVETLSPDLSTRTAPHRIATLDARNLDLLATPTGWMLAALGESLDVYTLDTSGSLVSSSVLTSGLVLHDQLFEPGVKLVERAAGGAFVLWQTPDSAGGYDLDTIPLAPDGSAAATSQRIGTLVDSVFTAATTPHGMLVAGRPAVADGSGNRNLVTFQISASGAPVGQPRVVDQFGSSRAMAPTKDGGVVLAYGSDAPATTEWVTLDESGVPRAKATAISTGVVPAAIVPMDAVYVAVGQGPSETPSVGFLGIDERGSVTTPPAELMMDPRLTAAHAARCGSAIIVALQLRSSFALARLAP